MTKMNPFILFCSILTLCCPPAFAQIAYEPTWSPPDLMALNNIKFNPVVNNIIDRGQTERTAAASSTARAIAPTYTPSKSVRKKNLAKFVAETRVTNPSGADQMEQVFASGDVINMMDTAMQGKGMTVSNAADAFAVWWVAAWQAVNGDSSERNSATYQAVSDQAARGLVSSPEFANATDAQKQEMAEALLVQAVMIDQLKEMSANDPVSMQKLAKAVKQGAKASGIDLDKMNLTQQGFAEANGRKTGAAGDSDKATNPDADPKALAANDTSNNTSTSDTGKWALIAAAGGAGLAGVFLFGKAMGRKG
jgi:hypothetical protein